MTPDSIPDPAQPAFDRLAASPFAAMLVALVALAAALSGVFTMPVLDRDEARYAQATAQMLETGDFIRIEFQDEPRHKKPAGIHWMQAGSVAAVSGPEAREIWAYRLPSALGAMIAALTAFAIGGALAGRPAGLAAGLLFAPALLLAGEGGIAKTDAALAAATALMVLALVRLRLIAGAPAAGARLWAVAAWAALALGVLIKGPITPAAAVLGVGALCLWERRIDWLRPLLFWPGPVIAALMVGPWLLAVQEATDGAFLREALGEDLGPKIVSGHEGHGAPPGAHLLVSPILLFPLIAFLPAGFAALWRDRAAAGRRGLALRVLIAFSIPLWLMFEIAPTKLPNYTLPAHAVLAVIAGIGAVRFGETPVVWRALGAALALIGASAAAAGAGWIHGAFAEAALGERLVVRLALAMVVALTLGGLAAAIGRRGVVALGLFGAAALCWHGAARGLAGPGADALFPAETLQAELEARGWLSGDAAILSSYTEPSLVFRLNGRPELMETAAIPNGLDAIIGPAVVLIDEGRSGRGAADAVLADRAVCGRFRVDAFNYSRGDPTSIVAARLSPECAPQPESLP